MTRWQRWVRGYGSIVLVAAISVVLATTGPWNASTAAAPHRARSAAASPAPPLFHIGPLGITGLGVDTLSLAFTNLGSETRTARLTLFDQDGERIAGRQATAPPGESRVLQSSIGSAVESVRGRVVMADGSVRFVSSSLTLMDGASNTILFSDHRVPRSRLLERRASTALLLPFLEQDPIAVSVTNMGQAVADYRVRLVDAAGDVLVSSAIRDVTPGSIGSTELPPGGEPFRVTVTGPQDNRYLAAAQIAGASFVAPVHLDLLGA